MFFFSSRRRHTRFKCDWSSDVCSSDLLFRAEIPHGNRIRFLRNRFQKCTILCLKSHSFSPIWPHSNGDVHESPVTSHQSLHLTLSPRTPSIQTYPNVCSSQHRNRAGAHSGSAPRLGGSSQARLAGDRAEVWGESGHAASRFF